MTLGVMLLDVRELGRATKSLVVPVQIPDPLMQVWIAASDVPNVALEVLYIHSIEADDGRVQTNVGLCQTVA